MPEPSALIGIALTLSIGAASPGPSFVMIARTAASSRLNGFSSAIGMGVGGLIFAILSLLGINSLFIAVPKLYILLKIIGGIYLTYLGLKIWRGENKSLSLQSGISAESKRSLISYFLLGATTQLSNPKTAIVYASVFATFLPTTTTLLFNISIVLLVFAIEAGWYTFVAFALSSPKSQLIYLKFKKVIDKLTGGLMIALGLKLASSSAYH
jgi:threonine/homoserine/homoserine lactone efflux protein